jgi:MoaA/NifB/PqqE/SkfB family radical SAM enzyme
MNFRRAPVPDVCEKDYFAFMKNYVTRGAVTRPLNRLFRFGCGAARAVRANIGRLGAPMKLTFAVTYRCQYRCATCNIWQHKPEDELSTQEVLEFIDKARGLTWVDITGGEIFLRKDIGEILEAMVKTWRTLAVLHFPTNGFLTDRIVEVTERIARARGLSIVVTVSVDGDEELNDAIRGISGGFKRQMATFRALRDIRGVNAVLGMTLSALNVNSVERAYDACALAIPGLRHQDLHINVMQVSKHYYDNMELLPLVPAPDVACFYVRRQLKQVGASLIPAAWLERQYLRSLLMFLKTRRTPVRCHALRSSCFIDPCGIVFPCLTWSNPVGDLRQYDMDLGAIWRTEGARTTQATIWNGRCPQCWTACDAYPTIIGNALHWHRLLGVRSFV